MPARRISQRRHILAAAIAAVTMAGSVIGNATPLAVTSCADDGSPGTLRSVIATAPSGATVDMSGLKCSTITLSNGAIATSLQDLALVGPGPNLLNIDGASTHSILRHSGSGLLSIDSVKISHGAVVDYSARGGCIYSAGRVALNNAVVSSCIAHATGYEGIAYGGGVYGYSAVNLTQSIVSSNSAIADGAGVSAVASGGGINSTYVKLMSMSQVTANLAESGRIAEGGGITATYGQFADSSVSKNSATSQGTAARQSIGGGIYGRTLTTRNTIVSGNTVAASQGYAAGGGIWNRTKLVLLYSTATNNSVDSTAGTAFGGAVLAAGSFSLVYSTLDNNRSSGSAGGVSAGSAFINDSTVSQNRADNGVGGGVSAYALHLSNATVAFNFASKGAGGAYVYNTTSKSYLYGSIVANNTVGSSSTHAADLGADGNPNITGAKNLIISFDAAMTGVPADTLKVDPQLLPLANYGGTTRTHALKQTSPAIDAGTNNGNFRTDQRRGAYARIVGGAADIGAFEIQGPLDGDLIFANGFEGPE
jgi:hypothetical protein